MLTLRARSVIDNKPYVVEYDGEWKMTELPYTAQGLNYYLWDDHTVVHAYLDSNTGITTINNGRNGQYDFRNYWKNAIGCRAHTMQFMLADRSMHCRSIHTKNDIRQVYATIAHESGKTEQCCVSHDDKCINRASLHQR